MKAPAMPKVGHRSFLQRLDRWMAGHPAHPRFGIFFFYLAFLPIVQFGQSWHDILYPVLYTTQCVLTAALLYRYRRLLPELNWKLDTLAIPVGVLVIVAWVALGMGMVRLFPETFGYDNSEHYFATMTGPVRYVSLGLRLLGMSIVVPMVEEMFVRSLLLRMFHRFRAVGIGLMQLLQDLPLVGEYLMHTQLAQRADRHQRVFEKAFNNTPMGALSFSGVTLSTMVFMSHHAPRDWPGALVCGLAWCFLVWWSNPRRLKRGKQPMGLGPVIWSHAVANAVLWAYCVYTGDWQFM
ncbi:MAG: hypothetical protein GC164_07080 [Phycisphaera sp.]|nr:hypothetical protein [Phycisphaera sp.]